MEEFLAFLSQHKTLILAILASAQVALGLLESLLIFRLSGSMRKVLKAARLRGTYTICPKCGTEIKLGDTDFLLPDGSIDNDLDGKPDRLQ